MSEIARGKLFNIIVYYHHVEYCKKRTKEFVHFHHNITAKAFATNHA